MKSQFRFAAVIIGVIFFSTVGASAGDLTIPNTFTSGTPAVAAEVNANFNETETAVDDNNLRIDENAADIEAISSALFNFEIVRTVSIPANAMMYTAEDPVTQHGLGLEWSNTYSGGTVIAVKAPADYAGDDVMFHIFFYTTTATAGNVSFFLRPNSYNSGGNLFDPGSISGDPVPVSGLLVYDQSFTIPANRMTGDWWYTTIQRDSTSPSSTYLDNVVVISSAFDYMAIQ